MSLQLISQQRARHALEQVTQHKDQQGEAEIQRYIIGMPAMILMSGFGQTCAFYKSKGNAHAQVLAMLADWLDQQKVFKSTDIMAEIVKCDARLYQLAQAESLEFLNWLKKFAKAYLQSEEQGGGDEQAAA